MWITSPLISCTHGGGKGLKRRGRRPPTPIHSTTESQPPPTSIIATLFLPPTFPFFLITNSHFHPPLILSVRATNQHLPYRSSNPPKIFSSFANLKNPCAHLIACGFTSLPSSLLPVLGLDRFSPRLASSFHRPSSNWDLKLRSSHPDKKETNSPNSVLASLSTCGKEHLSQAYTFGSIEYRPPSA